ncbi:MAG: hypothetical protein AAGD01_01400 [Acidobacteriota bacterium]
MKRRQIVQLAIGALGSLVLATLPGGPLSSTTLSDSKAAGLLATVAIAPSIALALIFLQHWAQQLGGRRLSSRGSLWELSAASILLLLSLNHGALRLPGAETILFLGWALLLGQRLLRQLLAARPLLGKEMPRRPSMLFFWLPLVAYLALAPWALSQRQPDGDEPFYLLVTHSLAYDFDARLGNNYDEGHWRFFMERPIKPQFGDPQGPDGEPYSRHNELLPLVLAPAYRLFGKAGAVAMMAAMTALLAWMVLRLGHHYVPKRPGETLLAYGLTAFAPPLLTYSSQIWTEIPATLLAAVALDRLHLLVASGQGQGASSRRRDMVAFALPLLLLPVLKMRFMLLALPMLALAWWRARRHRLALTAVIAAVGFLGVGILVYNHFQYGNPLKIHTVEELALHERSSTDYAEGLPGLFFDSAFGLFAMAPLWLLALPALACLIASQGLSRRDLRLQRRLAWDLTWIALPFLLVVSPRGEWYGGWSPPFRYGLFLLPLLALLLVLPLSRRRFFGARYLLSFLALATLSLTLLWLAVPGWTYNFADGRTYLLDHASAQLGADVARFFPSSVRPRLATWIWPLGLAVGTIALWRWRPRLSRSSGAAAPLAAATLVTLMALIPVGARLLPTTVAEAEDPWVHHRGGHLHPERWVVERTRYRGGWTLRPRESMEIPVVTGGKQVKIRLDVRLVKNSEWPIALTLRQGSTPLARWQGEDPGPWHHLSLGPFPWRDGEALSLAVASPSPPLAGELNGIVIDRVQLEWLP